MVALHYERVGNSMPKTASVKAPIEAWLATLDPDQIPAEQPGGFSREQKRIEFDGWVLQLCPMGSQAVSDGTTLPPCPPPGSRRPTVFAPFRTSRRRNTTARSA